MTHSKTKALGGVPFASARARLERDLLVKLALAAGHVCYRCGGPLTRDTFSVEHKVAWQSAPDPHASFFDLDNIAFSHKACYHTEMVLCRRKYAKKSDACSAYRKRQWAAMTPEERKADRRRRYERFERKRSSGFRDRAARLPSAKRA